MRTAPSVRVGEAGEQPGQGGLARAGGPHDRDGRARLDRERDVAERGLVVLGRLSRPGAVAERHVVQLDRRRAPRELLAVVGFGDGDRTLEDPEHPTPARDGGLGLVEDLGELGDRLEEAVAEEDEADHRAGGQPGVGAERGAGDEHGGDGQDREELARREEERGDGAGPDRRVAVPCDRALGLLGRARADAVGADDRGPGDQLGHRRQQLGVALAHVAVRAHEVALHDPQQEDQRCGCEQGDQGQPPVVDQHHDGGHDDHRPVEQPGDAAPGEELAERLDVRGDAGDEVAPPLLLVVGQVEREGVLEDPDAQAVERVLGPDGQPHDGAPHGDRGDRDEDGADDAQLQDLAHVDLAVDEALVDGLLDEDGHGQPAAGADEREHDRQPGAAAQLGAGPPAPPHGLRRAPQRGAVTGDGRGRPGHRRLGSGRRGRRGGRLGGGGGRAHASALSAARSRS